MLKDDFKHPIFKEQRKSHFKKKIKEGKREKRDMKINVLRISVCCGKSVGLKIKDMGSNPIWLLMN